MAFLPNRWQATIWTNDVLDCRRMYESLGLSEFMLYEMYNSIMDGL